jgi:hypothetical protein
MKKNQLLIALSVITIMALSSFNSAESGDKYLYVRVFESVNTLYSSSVTVTDGETIIKTNRLKSMRPKNIEENILVIAKSLNNIKSQGYKITSSSSSGNNAFNQTDYVFEKE